MRPLSRFVKKEENREKFVHRGFDLINYATCAVLGTVAISLQPYGRCPFFFFGCDKYCGQTENGLQCCLAEKIYFIVFTAYYISDFFWLWTTPKDWMAMMFHHFVALGLQVSAMASERPVIVFSCMILHDIVDVFLYLGKVLGYVGQKNIGQVSLVIMAASYFWLRLVNFGTIIYVMWFGDIGEQKSYNWLPYNICRVLVLGLITVHCYWFRKIWRAFIGIFIEGSTSIRDNRSDEGAKKKDQ
jgi:hypothetical protein